MTSVISNADRAISSISRNGTTFTATRYNGSTFTFTQQDNDHQVAFADKAIPIPASSNWYSTGSANIAMTGWTPKGIVSWTTHQIRLSISTVGWSGNTLSISVVAADLKAVPSGNVWCRILYVN